MQIKAADDKQPHVAALEGLLARPDVDAQTRRRIEQEIRAIRARRRRRARRRLRDRVPVRQSTKRLSIHDLRIELDGRVAQIDHLIINHLLDIWVLESKHFAEGVSVTEHGEWEAFSRADTRIGDQSPWSIATTAGSASCSTGSASRAGIARATQHG